MPNALVTGHSGFVGRHIAQALTDRGYWVDGTDIDETVFLHRGRSYGDDFLDWDSDVVYDLVVHCAYKVGGRAAIDGVNMNLAENVALDSHLFRWALRTNQKAVLYFSSSAAYPVCYQTQFGCDKHWEGSWHPNRILDEDFIDLDDLEQPDSDYGWAKLNGERLARAAGNNGLRVHVVRPFSGYGEDQALDYPFPSIIQRAKDGDLTVWGPPGQTRDWIHISDVVEGALRVYENDERRPVNLCTGRGVEMGELLLMAMKQYGWEEEIERLQAKVFYDESKPTGVFYRVGDPTRMHEHYVPKISIEEGVKSALQRSAA